MFTVSPHWVLHLLPLKPWLPPGEPCQSTEHQMQQGKDRGLQSTAMSTIYPLGKWLSWAGRHRLRIWLGLFFLMGFFLKKSQMGVLLNSCKYDGWEQSQPVRTGTQEPKGRSCFPCLCVRPHGNLHVSHFYIWNPSISQASLSQILCHLQQTNFNW